MSIETRKIKTIKSLLDIDNDELFYQIELMINELLEHDNSITPMNVDELEKSLNIREAISIGEYYKAKRTRK